MPAVAQLIFGDPTRNTDDIRRHGSEGAAQRGKNQERLKTEGPDGLSAGSSRSESVAAAQFARWNKDNGHTIPGLTRRRASERNLFLGKRPFIVQPN
jgi:hypothetical protein